MEENLNPTAEPEEAVQQPVYVVDVQFRPGQKIYFFDPDGTEFAAGDHVIMDTARGEEFGTITAGNHPVRPQDVVAPLRKILRRATERDERINEENRAREKRAFEICCQKAALHELDMQTVSAECAFDGSKILFYFTADERVDFRELVKDLASVFHTRIELRQIGVRDKARMVGGLGICGRPFCCASFLDDFQPVSIKMAKTQNLSLNPTKISGTCGRLMCCLKYEQDTYESLIRTSPRVDSFVDTPEGRGTVIDSEILRQRVKVRMENNPETISVFANEDIAVLRSGKAKKTDPPIPADLAPISGKGAKPRKEPPAEAAPALEPIRFRYSTEKIVEEPDAAVQASEAPEAPVQSGTAAPAEAPVQPEKAPRENRRRDDRPRRRNEPAQKPAAEAPEAEAPAAQQSRKEHRNNRGPRKPRPEAAAAQEAAKQPEKPQETQPAQDPQAQQPRKEHRSRPHRPHRPKAEGSQEHAESTGRSDPAEQPKQPRPPKQNAPGHAPKPQGEQAAGSEGSKPSGNRHRRRPRGPRPEGGKPQE